MEAEVRSENVYKYSRETYTGESRQVYSMKYTIYSMCRQVHSVRAFLWRLRLLLRKCKHVTVLSTPYYSIIRNAEETVEGTQCKVGGRK